MRCGTRSLRSICEILLLGHSTTDDLFFRRRWWVPYIRPRGGPSHGSRHLDPSRLEEWFERAARSTNLNSPDPFPESLSSSGPRRTTQIFCVLTVDGEQTQNHSFVVIVSQHTDFVLRSLWTNQNAHIAIATSPLSLTRAIMYVIRVVSEVEHARRVQYIPKLRGPKIYIYHRSLGSNHP